MKMMKWRNSAPLILALVLGLVGILVFIFTNVSSPDIKNANQIRQKNLAITGFENLNLEAKQKLNQSQKAELNIYEEQSNKASNDSIKLVGLDALINFWTNQKEYSLSASYAKVKADLIPTAASWNFVGQLFYKDLDEQIEDKRRIFSFQQAIEAFEKAYSLEPSNPNHKMNLALCYIKVPGEEPMKGIMMLREIADAQPDFAPVQYQLVKLAIETGQYERAKNRLSSFLQKNPKDSTANCLMFQLFKTSGEQTDIEKYKLYCN